MESSRIRRFHHEPVQDRGHRTRQKVLNAARRVLVRRGYQAARVEEITRLAQVGYGTFYKYFRNKQDVLEAVMEEVYAQLQEAGFPSQVEAAHLEDQIRCGITNYLKAYQKNREVLLALQPASLLSPRIRKFLADTREKEVQWMIRELGNLSSQGWRIGGNLEVLSLAMLHSVETVAQEWITQRRHLKIEELVETLCDIWIRVLLPSRPSESEMWERVGNPPEELLPRP
jgi:AcrR family transcriptional regulator